jgi:hypothetical protein
LEKQIGISKFYKTSRHASVSFVERMSHIEAASMIDAPTGSNAMMPLLSELSRSLPASVFHVAAFRGYVLLLV